MTRLLLLTPLLLAGCGQWGGLLVETASSSTLEVYWNPAKGVHHYEWLVVDTITNQEFTESSAAFVTDRTITGLKAATSYDVSLTACKNEDCSGTLGTLSLTATTEAERWAVLGDGPGFDSAFRAIDTVAPNHGRPWAMVYGESGPTGYQGHMTLWYDPGPGSDWGPGVRMATSDGSVGQDPSKLTGLVPVEDHGLVTPAQAPFAELFREIRSFQAVPIQPENVTRLFFNGGAVEHDGTLLSIDAQDVYLGHDFAESFETFCERGGHYSNDGGGACPVYDVFGPTGVGEEDIPGVSAIGQTRIIWPQRQSWRWPQDPQDGIVFYEAVMVDASCSSLDYNIARATWTGNRFDVNTGCPDHWQGMRSPTPVHQGLAQYKLYYFEDNATGGTGPTPGAPLKHLYARADLGGSPTWLETSDWESPEVARTVGVEWSDGTPLTAEEVASLQHMQILWPTNSEDYQVMYATMPSSTGSFVGVLQLMNP